MIKKWGGAFIVFVLAMGACTGGMRELREAAANRAPTPMSCRELMARPADGRWVRLTGVSGSSSNAAFRTKDGVVDRVYVALSCDGAVSEPIGVVMSSEDPALVAAARSRQSFEIKQDVVGMVRTSQNHETGTTSGGGLDGGCAQCDVKLQGLQAGYVVIESGVEPSFLRGLAWMAGFAVACVVLWRIVRA
jgi:hypothetical protein